MKRQAFVLAVVLAGFGLARLGAAVVQAQVVGGGGQPKPAISQDEQTLAQKITAAPDAAAKLKAAAELIKKYPKTAIRRDVALEIADRIQEVTDSAQKLALAQEFYTSFNDPAEQEVIVPVIIDAHAVANQPDQAFSKGSDFLSRNPDSLSVLIQLLSIGAEQAKKQNTKFVEQAIQYGIRAVELAETDKKPANFDDAGWQRFKTQTLPSIYQSLGLLYLSKGAREDARAQYTKASQRTPADAFNFVMLAALLNEDYQAEAKLYQSMPSGAPRDAQFKKVQGLLDSVIEAYARAVALSEGNAALQTVRQQYLQDLETYYKYRHNNSTAGMQQLIDKHKLAPKP